MFIPLIDEDQPVDVPLATFTLIGVNALIYVFAAASSSYQDIIYHWGFTPYDDGALTAVTSQFLHGSFLHLLGNMLYLWIVGPNLEYALGKAGFVLFYIACGCFGNFAHEHMIAADRMSVPVVGASGAIAGVLGAFILLFPYNRVRFFYWFWPIRGTFRIVAFIPIALWFVQQFMLGAHPGLTAQVAYGAHLGGFCVGAIAAGGLVLAGLVQPHWTRPTSRAPQYW
jgi:membrane associated rhomboid family serine protease